MSGNVMVQGLGSEPTRSDQRLPVSGGSQSVDQPNQVLGGEPPRPDQPQPLSESLQSLGQVKLYILLEEYKTLRAESLQSIQTRHQVVTFAFGALSVIIAGLLTSNASELLLGFIAYFGVPQIAKSALLMWLGEYRRSARAGQGLRSIEQRDKQFDRG